MCVRTCEPVGVRKGENGCIQKSKLCVGGMASVCVLYECVSRGEYTNRKVDSKSRKESVCVGVSGKEKKEGYSTKWRLEALRYHITK